MAKLKKRPKTVTKYIRSKLYDGFELSKRMPLELDDAFIYRKVDNNYILIHKPE